MPIDPNDPASWPRYDLSLVYTIQAPTTNIQELARIVSELQQAVTDAISANPALIGVPEFVRLRDQARSGDITQLYSRSLDA
jgi:hypothetical protein